jgi:outer membrane receptor protein involved in Fe transport
MGKFHGVIGDDKILTASFSTFKSRWDASGQIPDRAVKQGLIKRFGAIDNKEGGNTNRSNANFILSKVMTNGDVYKNQLFFTDYNFELYSNFTFFLIDSINGDQIKQKEHRNIYGYNSSYLKHNNLSGHNLTSEFGIQMRYDKVEDVELSHTMQRNITIDRLAFGQINELNASVFIDENYEVTEKLTVNAGARFDHFIFDYVNGLETMDKRTVKSENIVSPKLSLTYSFNNTLQLYIKTGTGFHSNDTRVAVTNQPGKSLPRAYAIDLGTFFKPINKLLINAAIWALDLEQEFVYVGDEAVVEPSGYTRRYGADLSARYQMLPWLYFDVDANYTVPRSVNDRAGENFIPLAPTITSIGGITTKFKNGYNTSIRYRYVGDRPANEDNSVVAPGYGLVDAVISLTRSKYEIGITMENILNVEWNEAQFDTESKLMDEPAPVSELHYTPGTPFFIKGTLTVFF